MTEESGTLLTNGSNNAYVYKEIVVTIKDSFLTV